MQASMTESEASHMKNGLSMSPRGSIASNLQGIEYENPNTSYKGAFRSQTDCFDPLQIPVPDSCKAEYLNGILQRNTSSNTWLSSAF